MNPEQYDRMRRGAGFIAALDQSGGSTAKALKMYGIDEDAYAGDAAMFDRMHDMRRRIITSPAFDGDRILGAILFEGTMDRDVEQRGTADYLWNVKRIVPFLKVDRGLDAEADGVQLMKPMPDLDDLLRRARERGMFGTKMRSFVRAPNASGIDAAVEQQFEVGRRILASGLVPILEPEVDIHGPDKRTTEAMLRAQLTAALATLPTGQVVMLKLTLPDEDDFYRPLVDHPRVLRVVALSGGYSRREANQRLARNHGVVASFSRALTEGLRADQSAGEFDAALDAAVQDIYDASLT